MITLVIANHKGGVGKTASCYSLADALSTANRVLMIDADIGMGLTNACGLYNAKRTLGDVLSRSNVALADITHKLADNLYIAPAGANLADVNYQLFGRQGREVVLKNALAQVANDYDLAIIDTGPALNILTVAALVAAEAVIIPTQPQAVDLRGVVSFLDTIEEIRKINPTLENLGLLLTFFDGRYNHHKAAVEAIQAAGLPLLPVYIGRSVRVAEAAAVGQSVVSYDANNAQSKNYLELAEIINLWLDKPQT
jgi:chromosome partitioning protein